MLKESDCEIHTFDCTYKGKSQKKGRHFYHRWCVGDPKNGRHFRTWAQITKALHHDKVDLLKMDIGMDMIKCEAQPYAWHHVSVLFACHQQG